VSSNPFPNNPFFPVPPFKNDPFDSLLNRTCSVWKKGPTGFTDQYGQPITTFILLLDNVPCFQESIGGQELNVPPAATSQTSFGVEHWRIFMRPIQVDTPPVDLSLHHYLQVKDFGAPNIDPNDITAGALMHNITFVDNPGQMDHHLEVETTVIRP